MILDGVLVHIECIQIFGAFETNRVENIS